jgi:hypothetical protein
MIIDLVDVLRRRLAAERSVWPAKPVPPPCNQADSIGVMRSAVVIRFAREVKLNTDGGRNA